MTLKAKSIMLFIISCLISAGLITFLAYAYTVSFTAVITLALLGITVLTIVSWIFYYIARVKYIESLNPKKKKYRAQGNRKNRRKG